ncbi:MAG: putative porin, partial [Planctomycetota bacterium]|nr:putative porin [Planctomycetota bacterium]
MGCTNFTIKNIQEEELMRETQFGRTRGTTSRGVAVATLASFLFVVLGWMLVVPAPATAGVAISEKLSIFGDFRARYEVDDQDRDNTGAVDRDRDRARLRARFGFKHQSTDKISFGLRLATEADALQSPHQTLQVTENDDSSGEFGLDRAYVDIKWGKSGFAWFGKHGISFWEQNEQFWDGDIQPEGAGAGYKFGLASGATLLLQSVHTILVEEGWGDNEGTFDDDYGTTLQAVYNKGPLTAAVGSLFVGEQGGGTPNFQGGSATYTLASIQYKTKAADLPLKLGYDWLHGENVVNDGAGTYVTGGSKDETGYVVNASTKKGKWGFQFKHYYVP